MEDVVIGFFATWGNAIAVVSGVVTAASALIALVHYLRHWRDDEVKVAVSVADARALEPDRSGLARISLAVVITNVGKVAVTVNRLELANKSLRKRFKLLGADRLDVFLQQGASERVGALARAKEQGVPVPKRVAINCKWALVSKNGQGEAVVKPAETRPAGQ